MITWTNQICRVWCHCELVQRGRTLKVDSLMYNRLLHSAIMITWTNQICRVWCHCELVQRGRTLKVDSLMLDCRLIIQPSLSHGPIRFAGYDVIVNWSMWSCWLNVKQPVWWCRPDCSPLAFYRKVYWSRKPINAYIRVLWEVLADPQVVHQVAHHPVPLVIVQIASHLHQ